MLIWVFRWNTQQTCLIIWAASSEFGTYRLCEQRRFRRACASAQSRQNLRCSLIQAVSEEEPSDRKPDPWPLWMAGHAQLKFVMTECSKTQIRLTRSILYRPVVRSKELRFLKDRYAKNAIYRLRICCERKIKQEGLGLHSEVSKKTYFISGS